MRADGVKIPTVHKYTTQQVPGARFISSASFFNQNSTRIISPQATLEVGKTYKKVSRKSEKNAGKTATKVSAVIRLSWASKPKKMESTTPQLDLHQVFQMCHPNQEGLISLKKLQELFQQHASENAVGLLFIFRARKRKEINHGNQGNFNLRLFCHLTNVFPDDQVWKKKPTLNP